MAVAPNAVTQLERAWHRLMDQMGRRHPDAVNAGQIIVRVLHRRMGVK